MNEYLIYFEVYSERTFVGTGNYIHESDLIDAESINTITVCVAETLNQLENINFPIDCITIKNIINLTRL